MASIGEAMRRADGIDGEIIKLQALIGDLEVARDDVYEAYHNLVRAWEDSWGWWKRTVFGRGDYEAERKAVERIWDTIEQTRMNREGITGSVLELANRVLDHHYPVISLFRISSRWITDTYRLTSEVYGDIALPEHGRDLAGWDGPARAAYDDLTDHQHSAVAAMRDVAGDIGIWLSDIAVGNVEFIVELVSELGSLANSLIDETGKLVNTAGVGVVWAVAAVIGSAVERAINTLGIVVTNVASMAANQIHADRIIMDHSYFPRGNWPEAVSRV